MSSGSITLQSGTASESLYNALVEAERKNEAAGGTNKYVVVQEDDDTYSAVKKAGFFAKLFCCFCPLYGGRERVRTLSITSVNLKGSDYKLLSNALLRYNLQLNSYLPNVDKSSSNKPVRRKKDTSRNPRQVHPTVQSTTGRKAETPSPSSNESSSSGGGSNRWPPIAGESEEARQQRLAKQMAEQITGKTAIAQIEQPAMTLKEKKEVVQNWCHAKWSGTIHVNIEGDNALQPADRTSYVKYVTVKLDPTGFSYQASDSIFTEPRGNLPRLSWQQARAETSRIHDPDAHLRDSSLYTKAKNKTT